jgi:hypothetical protein
LLATGVGTSGKGLVEGSTFALDPASGRGPVYFSNSGEVDPARTVASGRSSALFAGLTPGTAVLTVHAPQLTCVPYWGGWPSDVPSAIRVPIIAGFETRVTMVCR